MCEIDRRFKSECKELHKLAVARFDIFEAQTTCQMMIDNVQDMDHPLYYPLFVTVVICYARAFSRNNVYGSLGDQWERFPDDVLTNMHKQVLDARNKFVAHSDANARRTQILPVGYTYPGTDRVINSPTCAVGRFAIPLDNFPIAKLTCQHLISGLNARIDTLLTKLVPTLDFGAGPVELHSLYDSP